MQAHVIFSPAILNLVLLADITTCSVWYSTVLNVIYEYSSILQTLFISTALISNLSPHSTKIVLLNSDNPKYFHTMPNHRVSQNCTSVSPTCLVEDTIYGYAPSLSFNSFFVAFFALSALSQLLFAIKYKTYLYGGFVVCGCIGEAIGYGGSIMLHLNPYSDIGFEMQISCLIFSPAWLAAGIYITLKNLVNTFGSEKSRIPDAWYTWIFIFCDFLSLLLQAIGGGTAASAGDNNPTRDIGTDIMLAGIVWQVATLIVFAWFVVEYVIRLSRSWGQVPEEAKLVAGKRSFQLFSGGITIAFLAVFVRCVYRIAEIAKGWANPIMRDQASFIIAEGL